MTSPIINPHLGIAVPGELMNKSDHALVSELCKRAESSIGKSAHGLLHTKVLGLGGSVRKIAPNAVAEREPREAAKALSPHDRLRTLLA